MANVSAKDVAKALDVEPKTFRRFVREYMRAKGLDDSLPGRGGRYTFDDDNIDMIRAQYAAWRKRASTAHIVFDFADGENETGDETA